MNEMHKVKSIIAQQLNAEDNLIQPKTTLDDLGLDSLSLLELIMCLEMEFDITVDDEEIAALRTVEDLLNLMEQKL